MILFNSITMPTFVIMFLVKFCVGHHPYPFVYQQRWPDYDRPWFWIPYERHYQNYHDHPQFIHRVEEPKTVTASTPPIVEIEVTTVRPVATKKVINNDEKNPCDPHEPAMPNYLAQELMVSEAKCCEYIWENQVRKESVTRAKDCNRRMNEAKGIPSIVPVIVGGKRAKIDEFPHMGAIGWMSFNGTWLFQCGSSLISPKFALTAAHCTSVVDTNVIDSVPKIVRFGVRNILHSSLQKPVDINILRFIIHPLYKAPKKYYDITLLELEKQVEFTDFIQPACLWTQFDTKNITSGVTVTGWGVTESDGDTISSELQVASLDLIDSQSCDQLLESRCNRNWCKLQDHQICAGNLSGGVDSCKGDSGGPLQVKLELQPNSTTNMNYIIGVTSFGIGCAKAITPSVYTRVASLIDWIENNVWPQI